MTEPSPLSIPDEEGKKRLASLSGKTVKLLLNSITLGVGGDVLEAISSYARDFFRDRQNRRAREFAKLLERAPHGVAKVLESADQADPLFEVFLSVLKECLNDDEDEKVRYYAALMAGFASPEGASITKYEKMAMLNAIKNLRVHDLFVFMVIGSTHSVSHANAVTLEEIKKHQHSPENALINWDLAPQGLSSLISYGLVKDDVRQITAPVPQPNRYQLEKLGKTLWKMIADQLAR